MAQQTLYFQRINSDLDTLNFGNGNSDSKEIWHIFDTSVFCRLNEFFETGVCSCANMSKLLFQLSSLNINIHPLSIFEAAKNNSIDFLPLNKAKAIELIQALIKAQCIDLDYPLEDRKLSDKRIRYITDQYPFKTNDIEDLSNKIFEVCEIGVNKYFAEKIKQFKETIIRPIIFKCYEANKLSSDRHTKISTFLDGLNSYPYSPKLVDFCLHLLVKSDSEPLLKGFFKKIKTESENTLTDIAISEMVMVANFLNPFTDLRPQVDFFTTDKNLFYYSKLGRPLVVISPDDSFQRFYYPDINLLRLTNKEKETVKEYFKGHNIDEFIEIISQKLGISAMRIEEVCNNKWDKISYFKNQMN